MNFDTPNDSLDMSCVSQLPIYVPKGECPPSAVKMPDGSCPFGNIVDTYKAGGPYSRFDTEPTHATIY